MAIVSGQPLENDPRTPKVQERVVVKLDVQAATPPPGDARDASLDTMWQDLAQQFPGVRITPYFSDVAGPDLAASGVAPPGAAASALDRRRYLSIDVPAEHEAERVASALRQRPGVETAYREGGPVPPPVSPDDDPRSASQGYLEAAPQGVDARFAWAEALDGSGVGFVDLERGWTVEHEDLADAEITIISGLNTDFRGHGTAVLGEVAMVDNALGGIGIAPAVTTRVVSQWRPGPDYKTAEAILSAANAMEPGDVLLLEAQTVYSTTGSAFVPVEVEELVFDAIRAAVDRGIIVIEPAANGSIDLDRFQDVNGRFVLNRNSGDFRDSGAIMVGAGASAAPHQRLGFSNFGTRVDCYAWGQHIDTCGDGRTGIGLSTYTEDFGGTSGASPIVTGCALLLQSMRVRAGLPRYTPVEMRALLSDPALNTLSANPTVDLIGVMPDLRTIIRQEQVARPPSGLQPAAVTEV
jgi:subtilase family protein